MTDVHKGKRVTFANWMLNHYNKEDTKKWLFTDEKYFNLHGSDKSPLRFPRPEFNSNRCF
jgi:hypothetical protein